MAVAYYGCLAVNLGVNTQSIISVLFRRSALLVLVAAIGSSMSCMTAYDSMGRPIQAVDPGVAVAGVAAAGLVGYAIANNNNHYNHGYYGGGYYRPRPYYGGGGYYRPYPYGGHYYHPRPF